MFDLNFNVLWWERVVEMIHPMKMLWRMHEEEGTLAQALSQGEFKVLPNIVRFPLSLLMKASPRSLSFNVIHSSIMSVLMKSASGNMV